MAVVWAAGTGSLVISLLGKSVDKSIFVCRLFASRFLSVEFLFAEFLSGEFLFVEILFLEFLCVDCLFVEFLFVDLLFVEFFGCRVFRCRVVDCRGFCLSRFATQNTCNLEHLYGRKIQRMISFSAAISACEKGWAID